MKKNTLLSLVVVAFLMFACGQQAKKQPTSKVETKAEAVALSVDEVLEKAADLKDSEVVVKGTVFHVCKHGGERCFMMGSNEDISIMVVAGEKIGTFSQEQMGSDLEIVGILKEAKTEAEAHNPRQESGEHSEHGALHEADDAQTEAAHKIIADNQDAAEKVYFLEGIKVK